MEGAPSIRHTQILASVLSLSTFVTLGKLINLSESQFLISKILIMVPTSSGYCDD